MVPLHKALVITHKILILISYNVTFYCIPLILIKLIQRIYLMKFNLN